jgi:hypothetical protein
MRAPQVFGVFGHRQSMEKKLLSVKAVLTEKKRVFD